MPSHSLALATAIGFALLSTLGGCTTATPYQPYRPEFTRGVHGGYSEQRISPDRFIVRFHGNELAKRDRVEGYMLYRAAELTLQQGYDWFLILDRHTEHDRQTYVRPDPFYRPYYGGAYDYWRPHWRYYRSGVGWDIWHPEWGGPFWQDRIDVREVESFEAEAEIILHRGAIPDSEPRAFNARKVISSLEPTIERPRS